MFLKPSNSMYNKRQCCTQQQRNFPNPQLKSLGESLEKIVKLYIKSPCKSTDMTIEIIKKYNRQLPLSYDFYIATNDKNKS